MRIVFSDEQLAVINHPLEQHARVLAGPGTGKSATAVALASKLLSSPTPPKLKFLTFTRAATAELTKKVERHGGEIERPSTIHSFSISILLQNLGCASFPQPLRIPTEVEYKNIIRPQLAKLAGVGLRKLDDLIAEMSAKWESLTEENQTNVSAEERRRFIAAWLQHRRTFGYTLIAELPDLLRSALRDHNDLKGENYDMIIVDEYQDLNACDLEVLRLLSERGAFIIGIGDDDQSIYSFRKAAPEGIRRFLDDYQTQHDYHLTICHRCASKILDWSQHVIQTDPQNQALKQLNAYNQEIEGTAKLLSFRSNEGEAKGIVELIQWLHASKEIPYEEILILSRSTKHTSKIKEKCTEKGIPISDPDIVDKILNESSNNFLLSILRLLEMPDDSLAWCSLLSCQSGVGIKLVESIYTKAAENGMSFGAAFVTETNNGLPDAPSLSRKAALLLWETVEKIKKQCTLPQEKQDGNWGKWIIEQVQAGLLPSCTTELQNLFLRIDKHIEEGANFRRFLSQIQPLGKDIFSAETNGIRFMSMFKSKGLTVTATIVVGVDDDLIPHPRSNRSEERRLLYVAMTRATDYLFMTWATRRIGQTARSGNINVQGRRQHTEFLNHGPVESQSGDQFIKTLQSQQKVPATPESLAIAATS